MPRRRYEVYVEHIRFRESEKRRPWIVVTDPAPDIRDPTKIVVAILPISTAESLMNDQKDFPIYDTDPGFPETGLERTSYVIDISPLWMDVTFLTNKVGELTGELLEDFRKWAGDA